MQVAAKELPLAEEAARARFAALLAAHGAGLRRVARTYAARTDETEDLLQEIALAIWRALPAFRGECSERTFVFRVAHNRGLTFAERTKRTPRQKDDDEATLSALIASAAPSPEEELGEARRRQALWAAIRGLPPGARAVLTLALEGLSPAETGEVLGISPNAAAVRLSRAKDQLRSTLSGGQS
ncbi:MAG: sigma-70 family RNA polymerase sigma factor [Polyangiaceae bacterium]